MACFFIHYFNQEGIMWLKKIILSTILLFFAPNFLYTQKPEIFIQLGHTENISDIVYSPDGRFLASAGEDKKIIVWNVQTGREIFQVSNLKEAGIRIAFCGGNQYLISSSYERELVLWNIEKRTKEKTFTLSEGMIVHAITVSPDGSTAAVAIEQVPDKHLILFLNPFTDEQKIYPTGHLEPMNSLHYSSDGQWLLTAAGAYAYPASDDPNAEVITSRDNSIRIFHTINGKELLRIIGHSKMIYQAMFTPDKKRIISVGEDSTLRLWNARTGKQEKIINEGFKSFDISPDGKYLAAAGYYVKILDLTQHIWIAGENEPVYCYKPTIRYSPKNNQFAVGREKEVYIFSSFLETKETLGGKVLTPKNVFITPDQKLRFSFLGSPLVYDYDLIRGQLHNVRKLESYTDLFFYNDESNKVLVSYENENIRCFYDQIIYFMAISPYGRYAAELNKEFKIYSFPDLKYVADIEKPVKQWAYDKTAFSADSRFMAVARDDDGLVIGLFELSSGKCLRELRGHEGDLWRLSFTPDGRYVIGGSIDHKIYIWETTSGNLFRVLSGHTQPISSLAISADSRRLLSGSWDRSIKVWDFFSGQCLQTLEGHENKIFSLIFVYGNDFAVSGSDDGTFRLWSLVQGKELLRFIHFKDEEWIILTPDGEYLSSVNGDRYVNVRVGNEVYGVDQYRNIFYKPAAVEKRLSDFRYTEVDSRSQVFDLIQYQPPFIAVKSPDDGARLNQREAEIAVYIEDRNQPLKQIGIYINGRNVANATQRGMKVTQQIQEIPDNSRTLDLKIPIQLDAGENIIEITATNGFSETRKQLKVHVQSTSAVADAVLPNLWILAIGVNQYVDKTFPSLNYAARDANGIVEAFSSQKGKLFRDIKVMLISDDAPVKPTYENIIDNLNYLKQSGTNDITLLFMAGHGLNDESGEFYFLPADAAMTSDGSIKRSRAISWREIRSVLDFPGKKLVFVDACHAEGVSGKKTRSADPFRFVKELQDANAVIFTSSRGNELSQESADWGHGAFTYAIIQGLSGKANLIQDDVISMKELDTYVSETVPQLTRGAQHPITYTPDGYANFPVVIVK